MDMGEGELDPKDRSSNLQQQTSAPHAFQVSMQAEFINADCFARHDPTIVPARTFFSQLF